MNPQTSPLMNHNQPMYPQGQPMYPQGQPMYQQPGQPMYQQPGQPMYPQGQPMYQPPSGQLYPGQMSGQPVYNAPMMGRQGMNFVPNPLEELQNATSAIIKQENVLFEMITGCETANRYHVFIQNRDTTVKYLFKCKEQSNWCERNCCTSNLRPFRMRMKHVTAQNEMALDDFSHYYSQFERPFKCTCCCFCRPEMTGIYHDTDVPFGKIKEPCTICSPIFNVYNKDGQIKWKIHIDCCQWGFACRQTCCGKLSNVKFDILDLAGTIVGSVNKQHQGIMGLFADVDTFVINFPTDASPCEKMTFIGAVLLIDYRYYEEDNKGLLNSGSSIDF